MDSLVFYCIDYYSVRQGNTVVPWFLMFKTMRTFISQAVKQQLSSRDDDPGRTFSRTMLSVTQIMR